MDKRCSKCEKEKSIDEFNLDKSKKDGHCSYCRQCSNEHSGKYHNEHRQKLNEYSKAYYLNNKETHSARAKVWHQKNRDSILEKGKAYYRKHLQLFSARAKEYAKTENGKAVFKKSMYKYNKNHPERAKAHWAIGNAVRIGKMQPASYFMCAVCHVKQAQQYHHWHGYSKEHQLDVLPVCKECHRDIEEK